MKTPVQVRLFKITRKDSYYKLNVPPFANNAFNILRALRVWQSDCACSSSSLLEYALLNVHL
jgi:hypothetical protein